MLASVVSVISLALLSWASANRHCANLERCTAVFTEGHLKDDLTLLDIAKPDHVMADICRDVPDLNECISTHGAGCDNLDLTDRSTSVSAVLNYVCSPAGRGIVSELSRTPCATNQAIRAMLVSGQNECFMGGANRRRREVNSTSTDTSAYCAGLRAVKQCVVTKTLLTCGQIAESFMDTAWDIFYGGRGGTGNECNPRDARRERCYSQPPLIENGHRVFFEQEHGSSARYFCNTGFTLVDETHNYMTCEYSQWTGPIPRCREEYCPNPGVLENGKIYKLGTMGRYEFRSYIAIIRHGDRLEYECNDGYTLVGPSRAVCVNGAWSPRDKPQCQRVR